jgi:hypothetical protein
LSTPIGTHIPVRGSQRQETRQGSRAKRMQQTQILSKWIRGPRPGQPLMEQNQILPVWIRMPRPGQRCPYTGLSQMAMWYLTRPHAAGRYAHELGPRLEHIAPE